MDNTKTTLNANENLSFSSIYEALNQCFSTNYSGWMKACWPSVQGNGNFRVWFPKLSVKKNGKMVPAAFDCVNSISDDWSEFFFDDLKLTESTMENSYYGLDLIFAKEPKNGPYIFRGVYILDLEKSSPNHYVSKRVGTQVQVIGDPSTGISIKVIKE